MLTRSELYLVIRSLDHAMNVLNDKFNQRFDDQDGDPFLTSDVLFDEAIQIVDTAAIRLSRGHSGYHPQKSPLRTFDDMEDRGN